MTRERDILYEVGAYWVMLNRRCNALVVMRNVGTHSVSDSAYCRGDNGLSIAKARCDYLAKRDAMKEVTR